ncbi:helix-turn-helix domain-containing protein [Caloranaerobacter ferrireducens]|uniref:helix-turn-helix domain-containing protein n=1 Tax=Caloranaerobacter ferrireducens TaxID=1323370 RepID=UPI00084DBE81|nr:transcriptional regulator [Caloranaerobacter ferrireducens]
MDIVRIGDKVIDINKIYRNINKIIELRIRGKSQQEVADILGIHRTFISRLEGLGEIRKGKSVALIGFPIKNKEEVENLCLKYGVEYNFLMSEEERWNFIQDKSGLELFNKVLDIIAELRNYDLIITLFSDMRNSLVHKLLDKEIISIDIGQSPLTEDVEIDLIAIENILKLVKDRG